MRKIDTIYIDGQFVTPHGIGGRYELEFARVDQGWRISNRRLVRRYVMGDPMLADHARTSRHAGA